jgi:hypothetical protein
MFVIQHVFCGKAARERGKGKAEAENLTVLLIRIKM